MNITNDELEIILTKQGIITLADLKSAQKEAKEKKKDLEEILIKKKLITDEQLGRAIAKKFNYNSP